ncbi:MAG: serine hydrolase domain-containing protein [Candidatus Acidiferrum sp.]
MPLAARKIPRRSLAIVFVFLAGTASLSAQQAAPATALSAERREKIQAAVNEFLKSSSTPGIAVAVVLDGKTVWAGGFGKADLENSAPATPETLFRLASVSKPLTATAILQLVERGKLDLDTEVQTYCPAFPKKEWPITSRQLLGHLGGIRHYNPDGKGDVPDDSARHFATMEESLTLFANDPLVSQPGTAFHYSTYGYTLLGCVLEGAAHEKYLDYTRANLFSLAGMAVTQADSNVAIIPHRSRWYHREEKGPVQNAGVLDSSYKIPGGGFVSSAEDMARYEEAMLADKLVKRSTRDLLWTAQKTTDGKFTEYGMGWGVSQRFGLNLYGHNGGQQGTSTSITLAPEKGAGIVVLANMDGVDTHALALQILQIALDLKE